MLPRLPGKPIALKRNAERVRAVKTYTLQNLESESALDRMMLLKTRFQGKVQSDGVSVHGLAPHHGFPQHHGRRESLPA